MDRRTAGIPDADCAVGSAGYIRETITILSGKLDGLTWQEVVRLSMIADKRSKQYKALPSLLCSAAMTEEWQARSRDLMLVAKGKKEHEDNR